MHVAPERCNYTWMSAGGTPPGCEQPLSTLFRQTCSRVQTMRTRVNVAHADAHRLYVNPGNYVHAREKYIQIYVYFKYITSLCVCTHTVAYTHIRTYAYYIHLCTHKLSIQLFVQIYTYSYIYA